MKKLVALLLALITVFATIPVTFAAEDEAKNVFGATTLETLLGIETFQFAVNEDDDGKTYLHLTAAPGTYGNNDLMVNFAPEEIFLSEYSIIRLRYRTDAPKSFDSNMRSSKGESWFGGNAAKDTSKSDGKWHDYYLNVKDLTGGGGLVPDGEKVTVGFKLCGSHSKTLEKEMYVDIEYIACFKTRAEAEKFEYKGEAAYGEVEEFTGEVPYYAADDAFMAELNAKTEKRIEEIKNTPTEVTVTGKKYYVSSSGNDENDGLSEATAWQTIQRVNDAKDVLAEGDGVFFKRGDIFRSDVALQTKSGLTYSAYGEGAKPKFMMSIDASDPAKWTETRYENVWAYAESIPVSTNDIGTVILDGGRAWGIKVTRTDGNKRVDNGLCSNGYDPAYEIDDLEFVDYRDLQGNLEFYHNWDDNTLYLYCKDGNPAEVFSSIELGDHGKGVNLVSDVIVDNLAIYGAGAHGISGGSFDNVTVQNCTFEWIGGSLQYKTVNGTTRYGNAVESYGSSRNFVIRNNYATQVYDCCWTVQYQSDKDAYMDGTVMYGNVAEYCNTGLEVWNSGGSITNMKLYDNITRYTGYGFSHQRPNKNGNFFYGSSYSCKCENNEVYNNINYLSSKYALLCRMVGPNGYNFHDNIYVLEEDVFFGGIPSNPGASNGGMTDRAYNKNTILSCIKTGFEKGGKFYYVPADYDIPEYDPQNGVSLFSDIASDFWGRDAVDYVALKKYFNGVSATEFAPNGTMTRAMLVTVLSRMANGSGDVNALDYTDVNKNAWYAQGLAWARDNGIVAKGGAFRPDANATREEMADMLYKYADSLYKAGSLDGAKAFTDSSSVTAAYADGIKFCTKNGIIGGYEDGTIKPKNNATRAEVSTMINRFASYLASAPVDTAAAALDTKTFVLTGDVLKKTVDTNDIRATVDGTAVKFETFKDKGLPIARILDYMSKDVSFAGYEAVKIKYTAKPDAVIKAEFLKKSVGATSLEVAGSAYVSGGEDIVLDFTKFGTISNADYNDSYGIRLYPWGTKEGALTVGESFAIEEVIFYTVAEAAYAK